jgi:hypothetical protein
MARPRGGRTAGRRPRTRFRKAAVNGRKGRPAPPACSRMSRLPPSPRLPSGPKREGGMGTDPGRPPGPSRSPRFGSGCLGTRNPRKPSPANPGSNALQKGRASVCLDLISPLTGLSACPVPAGPGKPEPPRPGSKGFLKTNQCNRMMKNHLTQSGKDQQHAL